ncbi:hypothetical protein [Novosphingobium sp.]
MAHKLAALAADDAGIVVFARDSGSGQGGCSAKADDKITTA